MSENPTDWDAAAEVVDTAEDIPEYIPAPLGAPVVSDIEPVDVAKFVEALETGVEHDRLIDQKTGEEIKSPIEQANEFTDKLVEAQKAADPAGEPVSTSNEPIVLADPAPPRMSVIHLDGVDVISTPDRIQVVRQGAGLEAEPVAPVVPVMTQRMLDRVTAEQEAGRRALERNQARASAFPRPERTAEEIRRAGNNVEVFRPTDMSNVNQRHLLNTPDPKKGEGY